MPVVLATTIRSIIQTLISMGIFKIAEEVVVPWINSVIVRIMTELGVSEEDAIDLMANEWIVFAESVGLGAAALRTKIPTKIAERLGFTSKGFSIRQLKGAKAKTIKIGAIKNVSAAAAAAVTEAELLPILAKRAKTTVAVVKATLKAIGAFVGVTSLASLALSQWIDFGNWNSGAYQGTFNKLFSIIGLKPDAKWVNVKTVSEEVFTKVYETYRLEGATNIVDPYKGQTVVFNRQNMVDFVDRVGADLLRHEGTATTKQVLAAAQLAITFQNSAKQAAAASTGAGSSASVGAYAPAPVVRAPSESLQIKVFSGVVQNGRLGDVIEFSARPDDIIESMEELRIAAQNNLVPFLGTLYGRLSYETKIVSSIVDREGIKRTGGYQTVIVGYLKNGTPKTRTIINKWATIRIYLINKRGTRTLVDEIILGPVDSVKFKTGQQQIEQADIQIQNSVATTDIKEINTVVTNQPISVAPLVPPQPPTPQATTPAAVGSAAPAAPPSAAIANTFSDYTALTQAPIFRNAAPGTLFKQDTGTYFYKTSGGNLSTVSDPTQLQDLARQGIVRPGSDILFRIGTTTPSTAAQQTTQSGSTAAQQTTQGGTPSASLTAGTNPPQCAATNLSEWYTLAGKSLPSLNDRGILFESKGLGARQFYVGTAEQNNRLLAALKAVECRL